MSTLAVRFPFHLVPFVARQNPVFHSLLSPSLPLLFPLVLFSPVYNAFFFLLSAWTSNFFWHLRTFRVFPPVFTPSSPPPLPVPSPRRMGFIYSPSPSPRLLLWFPVPEQVLIFKPFVSPFSLACFFFFILTGTSR